MFDEVAIDRDRFVPVRGPRAKGTPAPGAPAFAPSIARYIQGVIGLDDINPAEPAGLVVNPRRSAMI